MGPSPGCSQWYWRLDYLRGFPTIHDVLEMRDYFSMNTVMVQNERPSTTRTYLSKLVARVGITIGQWKS